MRVIRVDHVQLAMPRGGEPEAMAFYAGVLGIPNVPKPEHLARRGGCWFEQGDLKVHLGVEDEFRPATKAHPAFIVDDVQDLERTVSAAGYAVDKGDPLDGYDRVYVTDPFGNRIEFMQPLEVRVHHLADSVRRARVGESIARSYREHPQTQEDDDHATANVIALTEAEPW